MIRFLKSFEEIIGRGEIRDHRSFGGGLIIVLSTEFPESASSSTAWVSVLFDTCTVQHAHLVISSNERPYVP